MEQMPPAGMKSECAERDCQKESQPADPMPETYRVDQPPPPGGTRGLSRSLRDCLPEQFGGGNAKARHQDGVGDNEEVIYIELPANALHRAGKFYGRVV